MPHLLYVVHISIFVHYLLETACQQEHREGEVRASKARGRQMAGLMLACTDIQVLSTVEAVLDWTLMAWRMMLKDARSRRHVLESLLVVSDGIL